MVKRIHVITGGRGGEDVGSGWLAWGVAWGSRGSLQGYGKV